VLRNRIKANRGFVPVLAGPGETFGGEGLTPSARYATDALASDVTETLFLSGAQFRAFVRERPPYAIALIAESMAQRSALLEKLHELAACNVEQRVVAGLLRLAEEEAFTLADGRLKLNPANHRILCEMVGATRESISLALSRLVGEGLAERAGADFLVVPPRQLLQRPLPGGDGEVRRTVALESPLSADRFNGRSSKTDEPEQRRPHPPWS
jgi:CRP-like cAMP-binding protein